MKNLKKCENCDTGYDVYLSKCPCCGNINKNRPLPRQFDNMLFLTSYKEFLLLIAGSLGMVLFSILVNIGFQNYPMSEIARISVTNFIAYLLTLGVLSCIIGDEYIPIFHQLKNTLKKYKGLIAAVIACAVFIGFNYAYNAILRACGITISDNVNQRNLVEMCKKWPGFAFFTIVIFGPICEEFTYRLGLFSLLRKKNRYIAYAVTIILFTLIHIDFSSDTAQYVNEALSIPNYLIPAFGFCVLYEYYGITSPIYAHILNNLVTFIIVMAA